MIVKLWVGSRKETKRRSEEKTKKKKMVPSRFRLLASLLHLSFVEIMDWCDDLRWVFFLSLFSSYSFLFFLVGSNHLKCTPEAFLWMNSIKIRIICCLLFSSLSTRLTRSFPALDVYCVVIWKLLANTLVSLGFFLLLFCSSSSSWKHAFPRQCVRERDDWVWFVLFVT